MALWAEFKETFRKKILLPQPGSLPRADQGLFAWMGFFLKPYRTMFIAATLLRIVRCTAFSLIPFSFSLVIGVVQSGYIVQHPGEVWRNILLGCSLYSLVLISYMPLVYENLSLDKMTRGLTLFSVRHILALPLDWHEQHGSGAKLQRVMQARDNSKMLYELLTYNVLPFVGDVFGIIITIVAMKIPFTVMLMFVGYIFSYLAISWAMVKPVDRLQDKFYKAKEDLVSRIYDLISLIRMTKAFALDDYVGDRALKGETIGYDFTHKMRMITFTKWTLINLVVGFWVIFILLSCLRYVLHGTMSIAAFSAIIFLAYRMWDTLENVARMQANYLDYKSGFLRIRKTLSAQLQNYDIAPLAPIPPRWDAVTFQDVQFSYQPDRPLLKKIDLAIPRNQRIALIGHSGAGKSTLVKLLMKQIVPTGGDILVGDASLRHMNSNDWLAHLALVPQDVELMNATLRDNILLDQTDIDETFYEACLEKAYLKEFVASLPEGDQTEIGERGIKLSGGQKQRLGIARALMRNSEIIILDEATSSLDSESEAFIQRAMETAFTDKTVIVIAHRLSTIKHADRIYVFDKGLVAESGSFADLEKSGGIFSRLWAMQSNGFIAL